MTSTLAYGQSTTNSIYIDQIGDGSTLTLTQEGQGNQVGNRSTQAPVNLQGDGQNVEITMTGNQNTLNGDIKQSDGSSTVVTVTGDSNQFVFDVGNAAAAGSSTSTITVSGSSNELNLTQGASSSATNLTQTLTFTGDLNKYTSIIEANDVTNTVTVAGDSNEFNILQNGHAQKNIDMTVTGSTNNITITQKSTLNIDSIKINSVGSGSTMLINQCSSGGC
jgi:hypothetical protein